MKVILLHNVKKIGNQGDVVDVADGYANGFLLPKKLAQVATKDALATLSKKKKAHDSKREEEQKAEKELFDSINGTEYETLAQANDKGSLFASIQGKDVAAIMHSSNAVSFDASYIALEEPIKEVGEYVVPIKVGEHTGSIKVVIEKK